MVVTKLLAGGGLSCVYMILSYFVIHIIHNRTIESSQKPARRLSWSNWTRKVVRMALNKIWNLRADPAWIELVKIQAIEAGRDNPGAYVRDLVCTLAKNPTIKNRIFEVMQGACNGQPK